MKYTIYILIIVILSIVVFGQTLLDTNTILKENCESVYSHDKISYSPQEEIVLNKTTSINETITTYSKVITPIYKNVCDLKVAIDNVKIDYKLQDYNCKETDGVVVCDSCVDGNCDGECADNGGETCCIIIDGVRDCKNGVLSFDSLSKALPVLELGGKK